MTADIAKDRSEVADFFLNVVLNHSIEVKVRANGEKEYNCSSPDEESLVLHSAHFGYKLLDVCREYRLHVNFLKKTQHKVVLSIHGEKVTYEILNVVHFTSARKRMSVIVRTPEGEIVLFCKGADDVIFGRMASKYDLRVFDATRHHVNLYAEKGEYTRRLFRFLTLLGLRTLCYAKCVLDQTFYEDWAEDFLMAQSATTGREKAIQDLAEKVELNLTLLGATGMKG